MHDPKLIEAMALRFCLTRTLETQGRSELACQSACASCQASMDAALCTARPDVAAVLRWEADTCEAAAWAAGAAAMRETVTSHLTGQMDDGPDRPGEGPTTALMRRIRAEWWRQDINTIRALPIPPMPTQGGNDE